MKMDLPDCPPGAEGYEDSVTKSLPATMKRPDDSTKAEKEFQEHLSSLKIKVEDGSTRPMVERRGRDISGKWIYLCFPCAAMCSGEAILQTHISGKKHKTKLAMRNVWSLAIFEHHPYIQNEKGKSDASEKTLQKMAEEVDLYNKNPTELDKKYNCYRGIPCYIQDTLDGVKAPLLGVEYLIEHPPEEAHHEPSYTCCLCQKQGHPRTIVNHMTCFWHRYNYVSRHFPRACALLAPYRGQNSYREGFSVILNRLAQRIEQKYRRLRPMYIEKDKYEKDKEGIHHWMFKTFHFSEQIGPTFEEVIDVDLINSLHKSNTGEAESVQNAGKRDPSPPTVAAPSRPAQASHARAGARERAQSISSLSDISDDAAPRRREKWTRRRPDRSERPPPNRFGRFNPYSLDRRVAAPDRSVHKYNNKAKTTKDDKEKAPNYAHKVSLAESKRALAMENLEKTLAYHQKNPEKHPLYPEEWKKFWNRRYKEIQAEGKDPSKHDFKPEWIVFWTARMKELHEEEARVYVSEIYRKLCLSPPRTLKQEAKPEPKRRSPSPARRRPSPPRRRSPPRRSPPRPERRRPSPERRRPSPERRRDRDPPGWQPFGRTRSRSPVQRRAHSPHRTRIEVESLHRRSESPLSRREQLMRNRSPAPAPAAAPAAAIDLTAVVPISDDELKPSDGLSPWNSDNSMESIGSLPDARSPPPPRRSRSRAGSRAGSHADSARSLRSRDSRSYQQRIHDYSEGSKLAKELGPADNVVATLRLLVALEDYLGSLGPKIVDMLTDALRMEKERPNSSEELLEREMCVAQLETAKEKLKGAAQAGLVPPGAAQAVRAAVMRVAATLHAADANNKKKLQVQAPSGRAAASSSASVPVLGVGAVDRAQVAQQMAAALIAQGKTDVSSEELAQLVDAVVGMAEAKKRSEEKQQLTASRLAARAAAAPPPATAPRAAPSAAAAAAAAAGSALQMLQTAYDEYDKKPENYDAPDAMDGLSDSDLETLLKNFNELSAEEQHSLIAYLKKLEAKEPRRVERLREYVSTAATTAKLNKQEEEAPPAAAEKIQQEDPKPVKIQEEKKPEEKSEISSVEPVTIESDDDDYTVEEVFNSAKAKVNQNQIRQEMEIVTKSLQEAPPAAEEVDPDLTPAPAVQEKNVASAANLLAIVQASLAKSVPAQAQATTAAVVSSSMQPRSFGDRPESSVDVPKQTAQSNFSQADILSLIQGGRPQNTPPPNQPNYSGNFRNIALNDSPSNQGYNNTNDGPKGPFNQGGPMNQGGYNNTNDGPKGPFNQGGPMNQGGYNNTNDGPKGPFNQGGPMNQGGYNNTNDGPKGPFNQGGPMNQGGYNNTNDGPKGPFNQGGPMNQGGYNITNDGLKGSLNQGGPMNQGGYNNTNDGPKGPFNQGGPMNQGGYNKDFDNNTMNNHGNWNQGNMGRNVPYDQESLGGNMPYDQGNMGGNHDQGNMGENYDHGNMGGNYDHGNIGGNVPYNQGNIGGNEPYDPNNTGGNMMNNQGNMGGRMPMNQGYMGGNVNQGRNTWENNSQHRGGPPMRGNFNQRGNLNNFNRGGGGGGNQKQGGRGGNRGGGGGGGGRGSRGRGRGRGF